jgi:hypothetical protein
MFNGGFGEARTLSASFPEDYPECSDLLLAWVYASQLRPITIARKEEKAETTVSYFAWLVVPTYLLAEKICLPNLQDEIMSAFLVYLVASNSLPVPVAVSRVYSQTTIRSPLRRFMARTLHYLSDPISLIQTFFLAARKSGRINDEAQGSCY